MRFLQGVTFLGWRCWLGLPWRSRELLLLYLSPAELLAVSNWWLGLVRHPPFQWLMATWASLPEPSLNSKWCHPQLPLAKFHSSLTFSSHPNSVSEVTFYFFIFFSAECYLMLLLSHVIPNEAFSLKTFLCFLPGAKWTMKILMLGRENRKNPTIKVVEKQKIQLTKTQLRGAAPTK